MFASEFSDKNPITDTKDLWSRVRRITGKEKKTPTSSTGITAEKLNEHYCKISTDPQYVKPTPKDTVTQPRTWITEESVFKLLDTLKVTAPGLDELPFWFLQLSACLPSHWFRSTTSRCFLQRYRSSGRSAVSHRSQRSRILSPALNIVQSRSPPYCPGYWKRLWSDNSLIRFCTTHPRSFSSRTNMHSVLQDQPPVHSSI